jgi:NAD+ synthetase
MKLGIAQTNPTVGAFSENGADLIAQYRALVAAGADLVLSPELGVSGYPPQDLLFRSGFVSRLADAVHRIAGDVGEVPFLVGLAIPNAGRGRPFHNAAAILRGGRWEQTAIKTLIPTYDVFDEARYFEPGSEPTVIAVAGERVGVTICEDIWSDEFLPRPLYDRDPVSECLAKGATVIVNLSASPFAISKPAYRAKLLAAVARESRCPVAYCNMVGGNDELVFDGGSYVFAADGLPRATLPQFATASEVVDLASPPVGFPNRGDVEDVHNALVLGTRDYLHKCGLTKAVLGLSGGIDSAVTAAIAVAALGRDNVMGITMPTEYSSLGSVEDSITLARNLGIVCHTIPIQPAFQAVRGMLAEMFAGLPEDTTEENIQPRLRGLTLMAVSNKFGSLLLTTGNKSELAVGYCTLYGDMCGGLAVISDVSKLMVYRLAEWINRNEEIIPRNTIHKAPSAELKPNQRDQDTLPAYEVLDPILERLIERCESVEETIAAGYPPDTVRWVARRVAQMEFKRAQAVPGLKVTNRAFGIGRRMPVAQRYREP